MSFSQVIPPSPSPTESKRLFYTSVSLLLSCKFSDINYSRIVYDPPPRILETKAKISKWDLIKSKSFCTTKETISKVKNSIQNGRK